MIRIIRIALAVLALTISFVPAGAQLIKDPALLANMQNQIKVQKELAKNRSLELFDILNTKLLADESQALAYLLAYMPLSDLADYDGQFFLDNARMALKGRSEMPWGKIIPEDVFLHFVLPPRVNNENLDSFRIVMYEELKSRLNGLTMKQAALEVNHWCHEKVTYKGSDERTSSPLSSIRTSWGRCGEESTFFVAALRMAGIPARQVYTNRWAHTDDNHAWVEVWVDGKWSFLGACEPSPDLNMGWFAVPATRTMLVNTRAYGWYNGNEPYIEKSARFAELNLISNYTPSKKIFIKVIDENMQAVADSKVEYQLYNYAEFYPLAKNYTDKNGIATFLTGKGDLLIWANKGNSFGYKKITVACADTVLIKIKSAKDNGKSEEFEFVPPVEGKPATASEKGQKENSRRLLEEDAIRTSYMKTFKDSAWAVGFARELGINVDSTVNCITKSFGNWKEITSFLRDTKPELRPFALRLLSVINEKDLRDTKAEILTDHLIHAMKSYERYTFLRSEPDGKSIDQEKMWTDYVLNGRVANEMMGKWRQILEDNIPDKTSWLLSSTPPNSIMRWIRDSIQIDAVANLHSRAPLTPAGAFKLRVADSKSRDILFVAACRAHGIAARLQPETMVPQWLNVFNWVDVSFDNIPSDSVPFGSAQGTDKGKAFVSFKNMGSFDPKYSINYTIAQFRDGVYRTLEFDWGKPLSEFGKSMEVPAGDYMLITGNRREDGSVLSNIEFFEMKSGETKEINVKVRDIEVAEKPWAELDAKKFDVKPFGKAKSRKLSELIGAEPYLIIFIEPDKEPSKHVMVDLQPVKAELEKWGGSIIFVLEPGRAPETFKPSVFPDLPKQSIYVWDTDGKLLAEISKLRGKELENNLPVIISGDSAGKLGFFSNGYTIGIGEALVKKVK